MKPTVDTYLMEGCGRCPMWRTPKCKVNTWKDELKLLRKIVLDCGLTEELKWSQPCYTFQKSNILIMAAFKEYCALAFFKGTLLKDTKDILVSPGKSSQAVRQLRFTNLNEIIELESIIKSYIYESIEVEKAGLKVQFKKKPEPIPEELQLALNKNPSFKLAFKSLTSGRQRGYIIHFSQPKQSKTRLARIEKYKQKILDGKGFFD